MKLEEIVKDWANVVEVNIHRGNTTDSFICSEAFIDSHPWLTMLNPRLLKGREYVSNGCLKMASLLSPGDIADILLYEPDDYLALKGVKKSG